ncbi:MAG: hypothetical protein DRQ51_08010 [Gammaproteobacteria bacterium]|nr:MAG: hypothetical protein DRQ51_08010 [Gammaproteobacteria bacterium]
MKTFSIFFLSLFFLLSCDKNNLHTTELFVFGTLVKINIINDDKQQAENAIIEISRLFNDLHIRWHAWNPDSELMKINKKISLGQKNIKVSTQTITALKLAQDFEKKSMGYFNPTIGKLIKKWGFLQDDFNNNSPPDSLQIKELLKNPPSMQQVIINQDSIVVSNKNIYFDFGAFGKGQAVDMAMKILKKHNIKNALINAGGDINIIGKKFNNPWVVAIKSPFDESIIQTFKVNGKKSIYTSGSYARQYKHQDKTYHHLINPTSGKQSESDIVSVSVLCDEGAACDAIATALMIAPEKHRQQILDNFKIKKYLIIKKDGSKIF